MNTRNFIPAQRLIVKRRKAATRRWVFIDGIYLLVLVAIGLTFAVSAWRSAHAQASTATPEMRQCTAALAKLHAESAALKTNLQSVREVTGKPDWSILLAAISQTVGDQVVLNAVECTADSAAPAKVGASTVDFPDSVRIGGLGRSQEAVTRFVLGLEGLRFFSGVHLVQTAPQSLHGSQCVGFQLVCALKQTNRQER